MRPKIIIGVILLVALFAFALTCESHHDDSAPSEPNDLHPNATSPDEQGESGSLLEQ
jgi:hypothetical protein